MYFPIEQVPLKREPKSLIFGGRKLDPGSIWKISLTFWVDPYFFFGVTGTIFFLGGLVPGIKQSNGQIGSDLFIEIQSS